MESRREDEEGRGRRQITVPIREARKSSQNSRQKSSFASSIKRKKTYEEETGTQAESETGRRRLHFLLS